MLTRKQYMKKNTEPSRVTREFPFGDRAAGRANFREYYGQFVDNGFIEYVASAIGKTKLLNSNDEHLNDIPIKLWDNLYVPDHILRKIVKANESGGYSLSDKVCTSKEAARQFIENEAA